MHLSLRGKEESMASNLRLYPSPEDRKHCGALIYLHLPWGGGGGGNKRGKMPITFTENHASVTVFHVSLGIRRAMWKGDSDVKVSLLQCLFKGERSTVRLGEPSFLRVTTIR